MSYINSHLHCVFSTKERHPIITPALRERLHILLSLTSTVSIAKAMQLIKGGSSKWVHDTFSEHRLFGWQVKYGAFGVSQSLLEKTIQYIRNQENHHRKMTFQEEFLALLKKHPIAYDERYLWE